MQNKLQELTDKLYAEGLSKGKQEGEEIVAKANARAEEIVAQAEDRARAIVEKAEKEAAELRQKTASDVKMAAGESIAATRQAIEKLLVGKMTEAPVKAALGDSAFIREIIKAVAQGFSSQQSEDIAFVLPESLKAELEPFVEKELSAQLGRGISASFSKKIGGGFNIGPKDGGWFISFTDETFIELISAYLRPASRKILFGE